MPRKSKHRLRRYVGAALVVTALSVGALLKATPDAYERSSAIQPAAASQFTEQFINPVANALLDQSGGTPLDVTLAEEVVNAQWAQFLAESRVAGRPIPRILDRVRIGFDPGRVFLGARIGTGWSSTVISQRLHLSATPDGRLLVRTVALRTGRMPMPRRSADQVAEAIRLVLDREARDRPNDPMLTFWQGTLDALEGKPVPLVFGTGRKAVGIRLEKIKIDHGTLHIVGRRVEPERPTP